MISRSAFAKGSWGEAIGPFREETCADPMAGEAALGRILGLVKERRLIDFNVYRRGTIRRMLALRVARTAGGDYQRYYRTLLECPAEIDALIQTLTVKVSSFFRNPYAFEALAATVLPGLIERFPDEPLRIWCAGCARGEEPYSVAMLLRDLGVTGVQRARGLILGTDVDPRALDAARQARYGEESLPDVKKRHLDRYFSPAGGEWAVGDEVRSRVTFATHDLTSLQVPRGGVFSDYHLILCRNVLIYLERGLGEQVVAFLAAALAGGGVLMLGEAEAVPAAEAGMLEELIPGLKIYRKRTGRRVR